MSESPDDASGDQAVRLDHVVIRFAGDSGDGMQLVGARFTQESAVFGNDLATLPSFPAEIRAPAGTLPGVSSFQIQFADQDVHTPGDRPDVLVAMNPAALKANVTDLRPGGVIVADVHDFSGRNLSKAGYRADPLEDGSLGDFIVHRIDMTALAVEAVRHLGLSRKDAARAKNMVALGLVSWMYGRPVDGTVTYLQQKFSRAPALAEANIIALQTGWNFGETTEVMAVRYEIPPVQRSAGVYRNITGNTALAYGVVAAGRRSGLPVFLGAYPITPASDVLHELSRMKKFGVTTFQAEDEIAAAGAALGAAFGGALGVTASSGPGIALKTETIGLAVMLELPLLIVDVQRGGPSTGLPTKVEQSDLLQAMHGRNGEAPLPVLAAASPADCFRTVLEAASIAVKYRTPVMILSDSYLANGSEPWRIPEIADLPTIDPAFATGPNHVESSGDTRQETFLPYLRDPTTGARPWAPPGMAGLEHRIGGLEKKDGTGEISYDAENHELMVRARQAKIDGITEAISPVEVDDPSGSARVLVLGWGSTYGPISAAVRRLRSGGHQIAQAHLRHLNPMPRNLEHVLRTFDHVLVPEMNLGQLALLLRAKYLVDVTSYTRVRGTPISVDEICGAVLDLTTPGPSDEASGHNPRSAGSTHPPSSLAVGAGR